MHESTRARRRDVLAYVIEHPGKTVSEIAEATDARRPQDTRHDLKALEGQGEVAKTAGKPARWYPARPVKRHLNRDPHKLRKCYACGIMKGLQAFGRDAHQRDGLDRRCKPCRRAQVNAKRGTVHVRIVGDDGPTSEDVARQRARDEKWMEDGAARLRENTDAVRPVRSE